MKIAFGKQKHTKIEVKNMFLKKANLKFKNKNDIKNMLFFGIL